MKNVRKLVCTIAVLAIIIFIYILVRVLVPFKISLRPGGAGMYFERIMKPDDRISCAVYEAIGEDLHYHGKEETGDGVEYSYELMKKDAEIISKFVKAVNSALGDEQKKISVHVEEEFCAGCRTGVFSLYNYSDNTLEEAGYDGLWSLFIYYDWTNSVLLEPSTYTGIEGIRQLKIDIEMQQRADEEGIDWYKCWPDLKEVIFTDNISHAVYDEVGSDYFYFLGDSYNASVYCYNYLLKQTDAETISKFVKVINSALDNKEDQIVIPVYADLSDIKDRSDVSDSRAEIFCLSRYSGSGSSRENTVYDGLYELFICDPDTGDEQFFPDPAVYTGIEGIKRLQIGKQMQQRAEEERIDWYECWPDLEEVTVIGSDSENIW